MTRTVIKPNGRPDSYHVDWSPQMRWVAGILSAFIVTGSIGTLMLHVRVAVIETQIEHQQLLIRQQQDRTIAIELEQSAHRQDAERHEDAPAKVLRIYEVGNLIRKDHEKDMHDGNRR